MAPCEPLSAFLIHFDAFDLRVSPAVLNPNFSSLSSFLEYAMLRATSFCALSTILCSLASPAVAATIDVALEDFQSSGIIKYTYNGGELTNGSSGLFRLRTANPSGSPADLLTDPEYGFCIELLQAFTSSFEEYEAGDPTIANDPVDPNAGPVTAEKAALAAQLWAVHFNNDWVTAPFDDDVINAIAFHGVLYEILLDFDGLSLTSLDLSSGIFTLEGGQIYDGISSFIDKDAEIITAAQSLIDSLSLSYAGPLANLIALTHPTYQDYLVEVVPEAGTTTLVAIGLFAVVGARLRRRGRS